MATLRLRSIFFIISFCYFLSACQQASYISTDRVRHSEISPNDLIDVVFQIGQGITPQQVTTFDPEWFRCTNNISSKNDISIGQRVKVSDDALDGLYLIDSFYGLASIATKFNTPVYEKFLIRPGTELAILDGPYCYGSEVWWLAQTLIQREPSVFIFGLVPEGFKEKIYLEPDQSSLAP